jgi:transposase-like protein
VYPVVFIDTLMVKIRDGVVTNRTVYLAIGIDCDGNKQVLGLWIGPTTGESAKFWLENRRRWRQAQRGERPVRCPRTCPVT